MNGMPFRMLALAQALLTAAMAAATFEPARLKDGSPPRLRPLTIGWEQAMLRVDVDEAGQVRSATGLASLSEYGDEVRRQLGEWTFMPASDESDRVAAVVLVAALVRPPTLPELTAPPQPGPPGPPSEVPWPMVMVAPVYPANAIGEGVVLVEVRVGADGAVQTASIRGGASGFDASALAAARGWRFRPARRDRQAVAVYAYLIFGFPQPVVR
jgi:TonB family protein